MFSTLRYRDFRLFWWGMVAQGAGRQMMMATIGWLVFHLTGSPFQLVLIGLLQALPQMFYLVGGALADRMDQRRLITISQTAFATILATLAALTVTDRIEVWHLALAVVLIGLVQSVYEPSRASLYPHLLPNRDLLPAAVPLVSMAGQLSSIGALAAGFAIASAGAGVSFFLSIAGAAIMVGMMRLLHVRPVERARSQSLCLTIVEGARYAWKVRVFRTVIGMALFSSLFALGYQPMLPIFAKDIYGVGPRELGLMHIAVGVGVILALLTVSRLVRAFGPGPVIVVGLGAFAASLIAFALNTWYLLGLGLLVLAGYGSLVYLIAGEVLLQTLVPDVLRGRVMGLYLAALIIVPLGAALRAAVADFTAAPFALAGGALAVLVFAVLVGLTTGGLRKVGLQDEGGARAGGAGG